MQSVGFSSERAYSEYMHSLSRYVRSSSLVSLITGTHSDVFSTALRRACGASCIRLCLLCRCNHPALPTRSKVNDWEIKRASIPRKWRGRGRGKWGARKQDPQQNITSTNRIGAEPGDTEQRLKTRHGAGREPRDQHGVLAMLNDGTCPNRKKREHREAKRRSAEKNKSKSIQHGEIKEIKTGDAGEKTSKTNPGDKPK